MRFKRTMLGIAGVAMVAGLATATLAPASAASPTGPANTAPTAAMSAPLTAGVEDSATASFACEPGALCGWLDSSGTGPGCYWQGNFGDWMDWGCGNTVSAIKNNANFWDDYAAVDLYYGPNYTGAHACISAGSFWDLGSGEYHFTYGQGEAGFGDNVNNNVRSHRWVHYCSQG